LNCRRRKPKNFWSNIRKKAKRRFRQKRNRTLARRRAIKIRAARISSTEAVATEAVVASTCAVATSEEELLGTAAAITGGATCPREVAVAGAAAALATRTLVALCSPAEAATPTEATTAEVGCPTEGTTTR